MRLAALVLAASVLFVFLVACQPAATPTLRNEGARCEGGQAPAKEGGQAPAKEGGQAPAKAGPHADVARVLDDWHDAAAKADETRYFDHFAKGGVFLGTDGKERWTVPDFRVYAHPHFAKGKAWSFQATRREIMFIGDIAWFDEDLDTPNLGPARGSGVVVRDDHGAWKIAQYNLSVPIPNERFKDVKTLIEGPP